MNGVRSTASENRPSHLRGTSRARTQPTVPRQAAWWAPVSRMLGSVRESLEEWSFL